MRLIQDVDTSQRDMLGDHLPARRNRGRKVAEIEVAVFSLLKRGRQAKAPKLLVFSPSDPSCRQGAVLGDHCTLIGGRHRNRLRG
jgi:hypothetical protein